MMAAAAAAAAATGCAGWGHPAAFPGGVRPSPPQHFTFEPPLAPSGPPRPRRRPRRRVLYPPAVRRPPPTEEPSAAKRLLVLLLAVVSAQVYSAPGDGTPEMPVTPEKPTVAPVTPEKPAVAPETLVTPKKLAVAPETPAVTPLPGDGALLRTAVTPPGTTRTPNGALTLPTGMPLGASCPPRPLLPALRPQNGTAR